MNFMKVSGFSDEIAKEKEIQFQVLNKLGIGFFEPRGIDGKNISELCDKDLAELKQAMKQYGIQASSIGSPVGKVKITDDLNAHFAMFQHVVEIAKELDARYIRIFSFYHDGGDWTKEEREAVINQLKRMIAYAKEKDVVLLHENEKDIYGDTIKRCLDLMKTLSCNHFKAVFDPANFVQCGEDTIKAYQALKPYIAYMHIKDAKKENHQVTPAGHGDGNIPYILEDLFANGYQGFISLEPHLGSFDGLEKLELTDEMLALAKSSEGTFTVAYEALQTILERMGK